MRTWFQRAEDGWLQFIQSLFHSHSRMLDDNEDTIYEAVRNGHLRVVLRRLTDSPIVVNKRNKFGETPLAAALSIRAQSIGANLRCQEAKYLSWQEANISIIRVLLESGADANVADSDGTSLLHSAVFYETLSAAQMLIDHGADVDATSNNGDTPLHRCFPCTRKALVVRLLLSKGACASKENRDGDVPLHKAAAYGNVDAIEALLAHDASVHARNDLNSTPLHAAAECQWQGGAASAERFISLGAHINVANIGGNSPLHIAVIGNELETVRVLIRHGADVNQRNADGDTPLAFADYDGYYGHQAEDAVKDMLRQAGAK